MAKVIASLSEESWITDNNKILNYIVSYYILTDSMQSLVFQNQLVNLPETYHKFINDPEGMASAIKTDLDKLISRYFAIAEVNTEVKQLTGKNYAILLYAAAITENNAKIELNKVVEISTTGLRKIINVNNYGNGLEYLSSLN